MKKFRVFVLMILAVFVLPLFCFGCDEVTFDKVPYSWTDLMSRDIIDNVDYAKSQAILNEIKMNLETDIKFTFYETSDRRFSNKVFERKISSQIGKDRDSLIFSADEKKYVDNKITKETKDIYEKNTENYQTTAYCYKKEDIYSENRIDSTKYSREKFDYLTNTTLNNFYSNIINKIDYKELDVVYKKTFEDVSYYRLVADIDGLGNVKNKFSVVDLKANEPELFTKDQNLDFVQEFSCEFGLKEASGTVYLTYFRLDYSITNVRFEKYLEASATTVLTGYGDGVNVKDVEDRGLHLTSTFVDRLNSDKSYCEFNLIEENVIGATKYTALKIAKSETKQVEDRDVQVNFFDYVVKTRVMAEDKYYYVMGYLTSSGSLAYKTYQITNMQDKYWVEVSDFEFNFKDFDFSLPYLSKEEVEEANIRYSAYTFKSADSSANSTLKVLVGQTKDVSRIEGNFQNKGTKINVLSYGIDAEGRLDDGRLGSIASSVEAGEYHVETN